MFGQVDFFRSSSDPCQLFPESFHSLIVENTECAGIYTHLGQCCLITPGSPAHSWQQLPNSTGEVLTFSSFIFLQHLGKLSDLFMIAGITLCSAISNQLYTFKLNYFPQTEHIIPHMNKLLLLLLETISFTIYESNMYSELI